jgi:hypothetical protein
MKEPVPDSETAVASESKMLAFLEKNFGTDSEGGRVSNLMLQDFGTRFVFEYNKSETGLRLKPNFLSVPLLRGWRNPCQ